MTSNISDYSSPPLATGKPCSCKTGGSQAICKRPAQLLWSCRRQLDLSNSPGHLAVIPNAHSRVLASKRWQYSCAGRGRCIQILLGTILNQRRDGISGLGWFLLAKAMAGHADLLLLLSWVKVVLPPESHLYPSFPTRQPWSITHQWQGAGNSRKQEQPYLELLLAEEDLWLQHEDWGQNTAAVRNLLFLILFSYLFINVMKN